MSQSTGLSADRISFEDDAPRPSTSPAFPSAFNDLYDVSPPDSPQLSPQRIPDSLTTVNQIPRRPVGAPPSNNNRSVSAPIASPILLGTLQQPVSPIPQPNVIHQPSQVEESDCCIRDINISPESVSPLQEVAPSSITEPTPSDQEVSPILKQQKLRPKSDLFKAVPTRPDDSHHLTDLPPVEPDFHHQQNQRNILESQPSLLARRSETVPVRRSNPEEMAPTPFGKRAETAPVTTPAPTRDAPPPPPPSMVLPSADQLARLNSRGKGRPAGLTDPRRPSPGPGQRSTSGNRSRNNSGGSIQSLNMQNGTPQRLTPDQSFRNITPRAAAGAHGSPQRLSPGYGPSPQQQNYTSPSHHRANNNASPGRHPSPNLRPPLQRLETIHSQSSIGHGEPSPFFVPKANIVSRQPSRAERSAAKNIKDAKKKGWRSTRAEKKMSKTGGDGASNTGWTDVPRESGVETPTGKEKKEKGAKCIVM